MSSSETNRLPVAKLIEKMHATNDLPIEKLGMPEPSKKHFIYNFEPMELDGENYKNYFFLVEVDGTKERILAQGEASGFGINIESRYVKFNGISENIGRFTYYCLYFENTIFGK